MKIRAISRDNTNIVKGVAILSIMLHNFFHNLPPMNIGENEFYFSANLVRNFFSTIGNQPLEIVNILFSFLGHYGVQLFIFISGYGLAMSMLKKEPRWLSFVVARLKKLYPLLLTGIVVYFFWQIISNQRLIGSYEWSFLKNKLLFIHTLLPDQGLSIVGPWWFFGVIFQLYLFFPILYKAIKKHNHKAFFIICLACYIWLFVSLYFYPQLTGVDILQNAPGHIPEFAFGILFALNKDKKFHNLWGILAAVVFVLGNYFKIFFPFTFLSITYLFIWGFNSSLLKNDHSESRLKRFFGYFGALSMVLFVVHGFMRAPFNAISKINDSFATTLLAGILFVICSVGVAIAANELYKFLVKIFDAGVDYIKRLLLKVRNSGLIYKGVNLVLIIALFITAITITIHYAIVPQKGLVIEIPTDSAVYQGESSQLYLHLTDNIKFEKRQRYMLATISFDFKSNDEDEKLPEVVCSVERKGKTLFWNSTKLNTDKTKVNTGEWEPFSAKVKINVYDNPANEVLKVYLYNPQRANFEYKNIMFKLEEI